MTLWDTYAQLLNNRKHKPHFEHIGSDVSGKMNILINIIRKSHTILD